MKNKVYQMVTDRIVEQLQKGIVPWQKPWTGACLEDGGAINYMTRKPYSFLNQLLLGEPGEYLSYKQVEGLKGRIKKGAKARMVVFYQPQVFVEKPEGEDEEEKQVVVPILKYYNVFHLNDVEGIESKLQKIKETQLEPIEEAEKVITSYIERENLKFQNDKVSGQAYYSPSEDKVVVPKISQYTIVEEYYSTTFHELTHSTMHPNRLNRKADMKNAAFGSDEYSKEELVAEFGSAMLCNSVGIDCEKAFNNSVAYIQGWLRKLQDESTFIVWAASRAEKAAKYILGKK